LAYMGVTNVRDVRGSDKGATETARPSDD
jgi:hypothetical protein